MSGVKHTPGKWLAAAKPSSVVGHPAASRLRQDLSTLQAEQGAK